MNESFHEFAELIPLEIIDRVKRLGLKRLI
jgi:hypothetical protein